MKIVIVTDAWHPQVNGVVRTYEHLQAELTHLGHNVKIISPYDFRFRIPLPGYREIEMALFPYRRLGKLIQSYNPDSIHIATEGPLGWAAGKWCRRHGHRYSTAYHTMFPDYIAKRAGKYLKSLYEPARHYGIHLVKKFHNPSAVVITTTPTINRILTGWGVTAPLAAIPRGVPLEDFKPDGPTIKTNMKKPIALFVGRVAIEKNIEDFLNMEWEGSKIVIGHGPALPRFQAHYPDITFAGKITGPNLAKWYRTADVFAFPSKTDTFGIVLIEALSCGLPVAAYPVAGPLDIVTSPLLGSLDNNLGIACKNALQATENKYERHDYVAQNYTWPQFTERMLEALATHKC